jgi:hypothetical protein
LRINVELTYDIKNLTFMIDTLFLGTSNIEVFFSLQQFCSSFSLSKLTRRPSHPPYPNSFHHHVATSYDGVMSGIGPPHHHVQICAGEVVFSQLSLQKVCRFSVRGMCYVLCSLYFQPFMGLVFLVCFVFCFLCS